MAASSTLAELEAYLLGAGLGLTSTNLTRVEMQPTPDVQTTLYEYQGEPDDPGFGITVAQFEYPRVQVVCRGEVDDYDTPRLQLEKIRQKLASIRGATLSSTKWYFVTCLGAPVSLGKDSNGRHRVACSFRIQKEPSRTV